MKSKGFTLIELIITIALIAVISVTVGVSLNGLLSRQKDKKIAEYKKEIEAAACTYAEINDITTNSEIGINVLIENGLLNKDLVNPNTDKSIEEEKTNMVTVEFDSEGIKKCTYDY